jgi:hypothetical protein
LKRDPDTLALRWVKGIATDPKTGESWYLCQAGGHKRLRVRFDSQQEAFAFRAEHRKVHEQAKLLKIHPPEGYDRSDAMAALRVSLKKKRSWKSKVRIPTGSAGAIAEYIVVADLLAKGIEVFRAASPHCSCDLVIRAGDLLLRVEVKSTGSKETCQPERFDILAVVNGTTHVHYGFRDESLATLFEAMNSGQTKARKILGANRGPAIPEDAPPLPTGGQEETSVTDYDATN